MARIRNVSQSVQTAAEQSRHMPTPAEQKLWQELRGGKVAGGKFRRQHAVGKFILDFYCPEHKLVIELDGAHHDLQQERDEERTAIIAAHGCCVLRFSNKQIYDDITSVLRTIHEALNPVEEPSIHDN